MNNTLKLIISLFANLFAGIIKKNINDKYESNIFSYQLYNCLVSFSACLTLIALSDNFTVSVYTVVMAVIFGLITLLQQVANLKALSLGPFSYTTVLISLSTLIPAVSGKLFWGEEIAPVQYIGMFLLVICFILSVDFQKSEKKTGLRWLLYSLSAFILTGLIGVLQKTHQSSAYKNEIDMFLIIAFAFSFVCSGIFTFVSNKKRVKLKRNKNIVSLIPVILMLFSGFFAALNNKLNLYLSGVMDSAVFFPVVNGVGLILTTICAVIIFKEKLSLKQWLGLVIGIVSVLLLCNPF